MVWPATEIDSRIKTNEETEFVANNHWWQLKHPRMIPGTAIEIRVILISVSRARRRCGPGCSSRGGPRCSAKAKKAADWLDNRWPPMNGICKMQKQEQGNTRDNWKKIMIKNKGNRNKETRMQLTKTHDRKRPLEIKIVVVAISKSGRRTME